MIPMVTAFDDLDDLDDLVIRARRHFSMIPV